MNYRTYKVHIPASTVLIEVDTDLFEAVMGSTDEEVIAEQVKLETENGIEQGVFGDPTYGISFVAGMLQDKFADIKVEKA